MSAVFVSHVEEDGDVALELALELEHAGYRTWCYEIDSVPGPTYLRQTRHAVAEARVMVVVISPHALDAPQQIEREVLRAFELRKPFIPIMRDVTHADFQDRQPDWADMLGASASIRVPPDGISSVTARICQGLRALGIEAEAPAADRIREIEALVRGHSSAHRSAPHPSPLPERSASRDTRPAARARGVRRWSPAVLALALLAGGAGAWSLWQGEWSTTRTAGRAIPQRLRAPADGPLVVGVMDITARGPVPAWMQEFTRDGLNTVLSKAPNLQVFSKQKIDFVRLKRGVSEIEAAEQLGIEKMISGNLTAKGGRFVLVIEVVDVQSGILEDSEQVEGEEADLVGLQNRVAVNLVRAMKITLRSEDVSRMFSRTNDSLESYKLLTETLGAFAAEPQPAGPNEPGSSSGWWPFVTEAWADEPPMPPAASATDEAGIRELLEKYRTALESKDLDRLASVQESMSEGQREALLRYFDNANKLEVKFTNLDILVEGSEALATFTRDDFFEDVRSGRQIHLEVRMSSVLAKQSDGWKIRTLKKPS